MDQRTAREKIEKALCRFLVRGTVGFTTDVLKLLELEPDFCSSAVAVAGALDEYTVARPGEVAAIIVSQAYDLELERSTVTFKLSLTPPNSDDTARWDQVLEFLDTRISDDDKLRVLVRTD